MSEELVASLGYMSAAQCLKNIDVEDFATRASLSSARFSGPFGVFSLAEAGGEEENQSLEPSREGMQANPPVELEMSLNHLEQFDAGHEDAQLPDLLSSYTWDATGNQLDMDMATTSALCNFDILDPLPDSIGMSFDLDDVSSLPKDQEIDRHPLITDLTPHMDRQLSLFSANQPPAEAPFLLSHYMNEVIPLLSPIVHHKNNPWSVLHLRSALQTLSQLAINYPCNYAHLTIFYALLAASCFHLSASDVNSAGDAWEKKAKVHFTNALKSLKLSLQHETNSSQPKKAKYKEILTAILALVGVGVRISLVYSCHLRLKWLNDERLTGAALT